MKVPRELLLMLVILLVVAVVVQQAAPERTMPEPPDLSSDSSAPGGAKAVYLWLQSVGYRVDRLEYRDFRLDEASQVMVMLAPTTPFSKDHLSTLRRWVERGGTLIVAGSSDVNFPQIPFGASSPQLNSLPSVLGEFGMDLRRLDETRVEVNPSQPLLLQPAVSTARVEATSYISRTAGLVTFLGEEEMPVAAGLSVGKGQIYVLASSYAWSNQGLGQADNAILLLNWLPLPQEAGVVLFDEIHHGRFEARSLAYTMVHEPWGWAILYSLAMVFLFLVLDGRRFGRAVPSVVDPRRLAAEYVVSLAGLLRRGSKSGWAARHYEQTLRRQMVTVCGLDPALSSEAVAARLGELGRLAGGIEGRDAAQVLIELCGAAEAGISERGLVHLAAEADRIIKTCVGRRK